MEVIRKLCLVANWLFFGGFAIVTGIMIISESEFLLLFLSLGFIIVGLIVQKIINWVFN